MSGPGQNPPSDGRNDQSSQGGPLPWDVTLGRLSESLQAPPQSAAEQTQKRKNGTSGDPVVSELEASLQLVRSNLQTALRNIRDARSDPTNKGLNAGRMLELMETSLECLSKVLTRKGHLVTSPPTSPVSKQAKVAETSQPARPPMADATTDTLLTPSWWDSDRTIEARAASRRRSARKPADPVQRHARFTETEDDTAMDTDAVDMDTDAMETDAVVTWANVTKRRRRTRKATTPEPRPPAPKAPTRLTSVAKKPPAILIKPGDGKTFADTVRSVRSCGLTTQDLGTSVSMRETRDGSLLPKGAKSAAAAKTIAEALGSKLGDSVGRVSQLGVQVEVEVLDLDAVSSAAEVLEALRAAIPGENDPAAAAEREAICDVRIWSVRAGQQIATAKMSRYAASKITKVPVGWTMCRVRSRTLPPVRCFRCQAFGHNSRICTALDRTGACWRCGEADHLMKDCVAGEDRCLACEMAGLSKTSHKPGSGACAARRQAAGSKATPTQHDD